MKRGLLAEAVSQRFLASNVVEETTSETERRLHMKIQIDMALADVCEEISSVEFLLAWILGYIHRAKARRLFQTILDTLSFNGPKREVFLPDSLVERAAELSAEFRLEVTCEILLATAVIMGGGE